MAFNQFNLHPNILRAIEASGYSEPTPIQIKAIPEIMSGHDIRGSAQTGTGKTGAFLLPAIHQLTSPAKTEGKGPRLLILVPTRELAMQVAKQAEKYSKFLNRVSTVCVYGGVPYHMQMRQLSRPYEILIATPGRLIDFMHQKKIVFSRLEMLVLDEADLMLDMGFMEPVEEIVAAIPTERQTLLFSATLQGSVKKLSEKLLHQPVDIIVEANELDVAPISQTLHYVDDLSHKSRLLDHLLKGEGVERTIVFTSTKRLAQDLVEQLQENGHEAAALHGDLNQRQRTRTLKELHTGQINVLVATDVASRGIDVQNITHVINFDLPRSVEDYVHRIGRTGRAGSKGAAHSFAIYQDEYQIRKIEKFTGQPMNAVEIEGFEPRKKRSDSRDSEKRGNGRRGKPSGNSRFGSRDKPSGGRGRFGNEGRPQGFAPRPRSDEGAPRSNRFRDEAPEGKKPREFSREERPFGNKGFGQRPAQRTFGQPRSEEASPGKKWGTPRSPRGEQRTEGGPRSGKREFGFRGPASGEKRFGSRPATDKPFNRRENTPVKKKKERHSFPPISD